MDVDRPQRKRRVARVGPKVGDAGARQRAPIVGAILEIDRKFDLRLGLVDRAVAHRPPRHQKAREGQPHRRSELRSALLPRIGRLHEFVTCRERHIERFGTPENIAVLVTYGRLQPIETGGRAPFQLHLETLPKRRCTQDIASQIALPSIVRAGRVGRSADIGNVVGHIDRLRLLDERDAGTAEIPHRHQVGIGAVDLCRIVDIIGVERHRLPQNGGPDVGPFFIDDVQPPIIHRVETRKEHRIGTQGDRVEIGINVDTVDAVDHVVVHHSLAALVVARQVLFDDDPHPHPMIAQKRVGHEFDVVDREIIIAPFLEVSCDAFPLAIQHRNVENPAGPHQGVDRIGRQNLFQKLVAEFVGHRIDQIGRSLPHPIDYPRPFAAREGVDLERRGRREKPLGVHVDLEVLGALARQFHVQHHGRFADLALPVVPAVLLLRVGLLVEPHIEIRAQQPFVGRLTHVLLQIGGRNPLLAGRRLIGFDVHPLQEILSVGNMARNAACRAHEAQQHGEPYASRPPHRVTG